MAWTEKRCWPGNDWICFVAYDGRLPRTTEKLRLTKAISLIRAVGIGEPLRQPTVGRGAAPRAHIPVQVQMYDKVPSQYTTSKVPPPLTPTIYPKR